MITRFKIFEMIKVSSSSKNIRINSYVVVNMVIDPYYLDETKDRMKIMNNSICQIKDINRNSYNIECDKIDNYTRWIKDLSIIAFSDNKEDLEPILASEKYNL